MTTIDFRTTNSLDRWATPRPNATVAPPTADRQMNNKLVAVPTCDNCSTEEFLYIEEYAPPLINDDGELSRLGETSYFCTRCLQYGGHSVPPLWTPGITA